MTAHEVQREAKSVVMFLVSNGLSDDDNWPYLDSSDIGPIVTFKNANQLNLALKDRDYSNIYDEFVAGRVYNSRLADGGLLQMSYEFSSDRLMRHRLAFWPSPHLRRFQDEPEIYLEDHMYAEVVSKAVVPFPVRFDFDDREGISIPIDHPRSHLTLGQYERCRIPVSSPLGPLDFASFILRSFYNTASQNLSSRLERSKNNFERCIHETELELIHVNVPAVK